MTIKTILVPLNDPEASASPLAAPRRGADLMVMGAYTHSRLREIMLGGVTRHILNGAGLAVLMAH